MFPWRLTLFHTSVACMSEFDSDTLLYSVVFELTKVI